MLRTLLSGRRSNKEFAQRNQELQQAGQMLGQQMRSQQEQQAEVEAQERAKTVELERAKMIENNPSWADEEKMKAGLTEIVDYARSAGFSDEELQDVIYSRHVEVLRKAFLYDQGRTVADRKGQTGPQDATLQNGRFAKKKGGKVQKLIERAQIGQRANKRDAQAMQ